MLSSLAGENHHDKGRHIPTSSTPLVHVLHESLLSAKGKIQKLESENKSLKEENTSLVVTVLSISQSLEELKKLYQEKEEMRFKIKEMHEDFQREKKALQDLNREKMEEICDLRTQLSVSQSRDIQMQEEVRKCELRCQIRGQQLEKDLEISRRDLLQSVTQRGAKLANFNETDCNLKEECSAKISACEEHYQEIIRTLKENTSAKLRDCEGEWRMKVEQLLSELQASKWELKESRTQMESISSAVEEILRKQRDDSTAERSLLEHYFVKKEDEVRKLETCVEKLQMTVRMMEGELKNQKELVNCLFDVVKEATADTRNPKNRSGHDYQELQEKFRKELLAQEDSWRRRLLELERDQALAAEAVDPEDNDLSVSNPRQL